MADAETQVRIGIRVVNKKIEVDTDPAFILEGYSVVWDARLKSNEMIEIQFENEKKCPFTRIASANNPAHGHYRRVNHGPIVTGPAHGPGWFKYTVTYSTFDREGDGFKVRAKLDPMIKI